MQIPTVSIITVVRNGEDTIADCLRSVIDQTYRNIEHIIIDGASNDGTIGIIREYATAGIKVVSEPDQGIYDAMNKGIRNSSGEIIGILNADDMYYDNNVIESVVNAFIHENIDSCYGDLIYVDRTNPTRKTRFWRAGEYGRKRFYHGWMPPHPTFFVRRKIYEKYGVFDLKMGTAADYELILRFLVKENISTTYIPGILVKMRIGGVSNASLLSRLRANRMDRNAWTVNGLTPRSWTLIMKPVRKILQFFL